MIRQRPIRARRSYPENSLRYTTSPDGAYRIYPDGREVCQPNAAGWREYKRRVELMVIRQNFRCSLCNRRLTLANATFEHHRRRGMSGSFRQDKISDDQGNWINSASHWLCNTERG